MFWEVKYWFVFQLNMTFYLFVCALAGAGAAVISMVSQITIGISVNVRGYLISHLVVTKQIGMSLLLDNHCTGNKLFNPN